MTSTESSSCPLCQTPIDVRSHRRTYRSRYDETQYRLYRCEACDLLFWSPRRLTADFYERAGISAYESFHAGTRPFPRWTLPFFDRIPRRSGLLLDVGCGDGAFLHRAANLGFAVHGIDFDRHSVAVARERYGLNNVDATTLGEHAERCRREGIRYDVITFFEVLEHQDDPLAFLRQITALLKPGGYLAGSVPNRERFLGALERRFDDGDLPPHHFLWFSAAVLRAFLARLGFTDVFVGFARQMGAMETNQRLMRIAERKTARLPTIVRGAARGAIWIAAWPATLVLWTGMQLRPQHIYFHAQSPV